MSKARELAELGAVYDSGALSNRNLIINGAMQVAQRGTSSTTTSGYTTVDRWPGFAGGYSTLAVTKTQDTDAPEGFAYSHKITVNTAQSPSATGYLEVNQRLESQNLQKLKYGTSSAETVTLSFWVKSSVTGTYATALYSFDTSKMYPETYTINSANTWEYKTISFAGDTASALGNDANEGLRAVFFVSAGSTVATSVTNAWQTFSSTGYASGHTADVTGTASATWQLTGVQLEVGSEATPFEHRSYGDELQRCKRYYEGGTYAERNNNNNAGRWWADDGVENGNRAFPSDRNFAVEKRATPTLSIQSAQTGTADKLSGYSSGTEYTCTSVAGTTRHTICNYFQMSGSGTGALPDQPVVAYIEVDAEL